MMHILEGESLLNDASGLVCMRFAVAAMLTGSFSLVGAFLTFLWVALGGVAIGVCVTWAVTRIKQWVTASLARTPAQILISLLIPFGAYLIAEHFHCSGILAAVAAGITMRPMPSNRARRWASPASIAPPSGTPCSSPPTA
jgi:NhaP-type Na+/H+ or K+/H+ antiporter